MAAFHVPRLVNACMQQSCMQAICCVPCVFAVAPSYSSPGCWWLRPQTPQTAQLGNIKAAPTNATGNHATAAAARAPNATLFVNHMHATVEIYQEPPTPPAVDAAPAIALATTAQTARQVATALEMTTNTNVAQVSAAACCSSCCAPNLFLCIGCRLLSACRWSIRLQFMLPW